MAPPSPSRLLRSISMAVGVGLVCPFAHATLIDFEDAPWNPYDWPGQPLRTHYQDLGVTFSDAYVVGEGQGQPTDKQVLGSSGFSVSFIGASLPTYVSFNMSSADIPGAEARVQAWNGEQQVALGRTGGFFPTENGPVTVLPYVPDRLIVLSAPQGISHLTFSNSYIARFTATMDNLYFGDVAPVPEPSTWLMLAAGLPLLAGGRRWAGRRRR